VQSKWKNQTRASAKNEMKQAKSTKTSQQTSEVKNNRNPEMMAERRVGQTRSPGVY